MQINKKGFTLLELLVVVLIIGILAAIALPQYQMAVTKSRVASILPLMRRWKDALQEYALQHGSYMTEDDDYPDADTLGVNWPTDWYCFNHMNGCYCKNDYWDGCIANESQNGEVTCFHFTSDGEFQIRLFQPDDSECEICRDKMLCIADGEEGNKLCKSFGGQLIDDVFGFQYTYIL